ncbi:MAG: hypothetical protein PHG23_00020 [Candidatus Pacebacteria bacterium]|nr:hypothetical protein [Candidatus Paceibacterota bacterium]
MSLEQINNFFISPELTSYLLPLKIVFIIASAAFLYLIGYYIIKQVLMINERKRMFQDFFGKQDFNSYSYLFNRWKEIEKVAATKDEINYKLAIMNSEGLLFDLFRSLKYEGKELKELIPQAVDKGLVENPEVLNALIDLSHKIKADPVYKLDPEKAEYLLAGVREVVARLKIV